MDALPPATLLMLDLPPRAAAEGLAVESFDRQVPAIEPRFRRYLTKFGILRESKLLYNHTVRYHNERDLELYSLLRPGDDSIHFLERHRRADLMCTGEMYSTTIREIARRPPVENNRCASRGMNGYAPNAGEVHLDSRGCACSRFVTTTPSAVRHQTNGLNSAAVPIALRKIAKSLLQAQGR